MSNAKPKLGTKENPLIGFPAPRGSQWKILGKWPHGHIEDSGPQTDQEVLALYERPDEREKVKTALRTLRTATQVE